MPQTAPKGATNAIKLPVKVQRHTGEFKSHHRTQNEASNSRSVTHRNGCSQTWIQTYKGNLASMDARRERINKPTTTPTSNSKLLNASRRASFARGQNCAWQQLRAALVALSQFSYTCEVSFRPLYLPPKATPFACRLYTACDTQEAKHSLNVVG